MTTQRFIRSTLPTLLAIALLATVSGSAEAKEKKEKIEQYTARAFNVQKGRAANINIVINEWTTPEEREGLIQTFLDGGSKALYNALNHKSEKAYLKLAGSLGYDMQYAWQVEIEGKRRIVLATDRPMGFLELARNTRSTDYNVSLVVLELDPETGEGEGSAVGGAELSIDKETKRLNIEFAGTQPTKLVKVTRTFPKKKKKKKNE